MLFIKNKYNKWYWNIIENSKMRILENNVYTEKHHIIPKSLGGPDSLDNIATLTAKEHFICHLLLTKMVEGKARASMCYAAWQMTMSNNRPRYKVSSRMYELLRTQLSESLIGRTFSEETKRKIGAKSAGRKPMLGKTHSAETKQKISDAHTGKSRKPFTEATKLKMSLTRKGMNVDHSGENNPMYGNKQRLTTKELISKANSGKNNGMYGKYKNSPVIQCPHCSKSGKEGPNFIRWHFDNCKSRR